MFLITASENTSKLKQNASCRKLNVQMTINLKTNSLLKKEQPYANHDDPENNMV